MNYVIKEKDNKTYNIKKIEVQNIKSLSENAIKILKILSQKEMYPKQIAQVLKMNEQKIYYYINLLKKTKLIDVAREEKYGGLIAKYYTCSSDGAFVLWSKTAAEKKAGKDAGFYAKFLEAVAKDPIVDNRDLSAGTDVNAPAEKKEPSEEAKNAFN